LINNPKGKSSGEFGRNNMGRLIHTLGIIGLLGIAGCGESAEQTNFIRKKSDNPYELKSYHLGNRSNFSSSSMGYAPVPAVGDFNNDGFSDFLTINRGGDITLFSKGIPVNFKNKTILSPDSSRSSAPAGYHPTPAVGDFNNDGLLDFLVIGRNGSIEVFENQGTGKSEK
jgi:hypothetical protein